ncbi:CPBP family intramembrane glutamic endopeptidase [Bacillus horti]|uniref:Membrane protease YdiL (CAAX protease family) n=1 Tax=Caldalkalibacillus horti TaxID=77523 RepID=A0ABT9VWW0_9BACI|nr:CPBP family intramembrane glutamic endopeptidase [Bacillus horti]MDQ0165302.1 membrane protease YdiL (CAAX protease family) [Bacillus horti]
MSAIFISLLIIPIVILARRYLDRRPWKGLRLTSFRAGWKSFLIGALCYSIPAAGALTVFILMGWTSVSIQMSAGEFLLAVLTVMLLVFLYEAFPEELLFRGYFYRNLNHAWSRRQAVIGQAILFVLFAFMIGAASDWSRIIIFFGVGVVIGIVRVVTQNVWSAIGLHLAFQTMQQFFTNRGEYDISISSPGLIEMMILGIIPFSFSIVTLQLFIKKQPDWNEVKPE